jgi:hypothetical protein
LSKVIATVAELPLSIREFKENVVLLELWHSPKSAPFDILLGDILNNIEKLRTNGLSLQLEGSKYELFVFDKKLN